MKGYLGTILVVDLTTGTIEKRTIPDVVYEHLLSGVGLGAWYLNREIPPGADPLGPDNVLGITSGLLTGTGSVMTGRWMAMCKSPLTGGWGDSNCGGNLAIAIKQCGVDAIFFHGISRKPVYLFMDNKGAELRDAKGYWGLDAVEAEEALIRDCWRRKKPAVAVIGPAAEKLSLISGISNDLGRYAARSGVGAVMGSKRLKGIVLAGAKAVKGHDPAALRSLSKEYADKVRKTNAPGVLSGAVLPILGKAMGSLKTVVPMDGMMTTMLLKKYGSIMNNTLSIPNGDAPLKNWGGSDRDYHRGYYKSLNPDKLLKRETRKYHCYSCIVGCGGICDISDLDGGKVKHSHKPEYETSMVFGGLLMNRDTDSIFVLNEICNRAGLDTISVGGVVAFAIECFENGLLTEEDTGGLRLKWGDAEAIIALVKKIAAREEGIGDLLADGVKRAAAKLGKGSEAYAVHAGGQELPMHDPKVDPILGTTYSADPTPGRHTTSGGLYYTASALWEEVSWLPKLKPHPRAHDFEPSEEETLKNIAYTSFKMLVDGTGGCYYAALSGVRHFKIFAYLNAATGWSKTADEYMEIGKRMQTLRQQFNARQGADVKGFRMHRRAVGEPPLKTGHNRGTTLKLDEMVRLYRLGWGWDPETGYPTEETLRESGLTDLLQDPDLVGVNHG